AQRLRCSLGCSAASARRLMVRKAHSRATGSLDSGTRGRRRGRTRAPAPRLARSFGVVRPRPKEGPGVSPGPSGTVLDHLNLKLALCSGPPSLSLTVTWRHVLLHDFSVFHTYLYWSALAS